MPRRIFDKIGLQGRAFIYKWDAKMVPTFDDYVTLRDNLDLEDKAILGVLKRRNILLQVSRAIHAPILLGKALTFIPKPLWPKWNLITTVGKQKVCDYLVNSAPSGFTHVAIGTGVNAPAIGDTTLQTQTDRIAASDKRRQGTDSKFDVFFSSTSPAVGGVIAEMGIFDAAAGGNLYARSLVSPTQNFATGTTLTFAYTSGF